MSMVIISLVLILTRNSGKKYVIFVTEYMPDGNLSNHFSKKVQAADVDSIEF